MVCSLRITTLGIGTAWGILAGFFAFVDISTKPSDLESEALGADAEAVARASENAFLVLWAWVRG